MSKKNKCYQVISEKKKWFYGAFPLTEKGFEDAKKYVNVVQKKTKDKITIVEK